MPGNKARIGALRCQFQRTWICGRLVGVNIAPVLLSRVPLQLRAVLFMAQAVNGTVTRNRGQPRQYLALALIEPVRSSPGTQISLLKHVLGFTTVAINAQNHREYLTAGEAVNGSKRDTTTCASLKHHLRNMCRAILKVDIYN